MGANCQCAGPKAEELHPNIHELKQLFLQTNVPVCSSCSLISVHVTDALQGCRLLFSIAG